MQREHSMTQEQWQFRSTDLEVAKRYFGQLHYEVGNLHHHGRHVIGMVRKDTKEYFLKLAQSPAIGQRTANEFAWDRVISALRLPVRIPKAYDHGKFADCFWFTAEYFPHAKPLDNGGAHLSLMAKTAHQIMQLEPGTLLPRDQEVAGQSLVEQANRKVANYLKDIKRNTTQLQMFMQERLHLLTPAPMHGDFVPEHFLSTQKGIVLIDAESSQANGFAFYDIAYFYHRVYTKLHQPETAAMFLQEFEKMHPFSENEREAFRCLLAMRLIGGYLDAQSDGVTSVVLQEMLEKKLLTTAV